MPKLVCYCYGGVPATKLNEVQQARMINKYNQFKTGIKLGSYDCDVLHGFETALILMGYEIVDEEKIEGGKENVCHSR